MHKLCLYNWSCFPAHLAVADDFTYRATAHCGNKHAKYHRLEEEDDSHYSNMIKQKKGSNTIENKQYSLCASSI